MSLDMFRDIMPFSYLYYIRCAVMQPVSGWWMAIVQFA